MFIDSHCHLDRLKLNAYEGDLDKALDAAREAGVSSMLCVSIDRDNVHDVLRIAGQNKDIFASVGIHPSSVDDLPLSLDELLGLASQPKVIAIGETGLDYYYSEDLKTQQLESFEMHLAAAKACRKPVIVHTRDAQQDTLDHIAKYSDPEVAGVLHCFTESWDMARQAMDHNFYISFSGIVTFKNATELKEVARKVPLDRMLIETDSPYLAPVPYRGKPNEPRFVPEVARYLAELKGVSVEELAEATSANFYRLFKDARPLEA